MDVLELRTEHGDGASVVIDLRGELDAATAPDLKALVAELVERGDTRIVLDLRDLTFVDSTGLGAFVGARNRARDAGGSLLLREVPDRVASILTLVGLDGVLEVDQQRWVDVDVAGLAAR